MSAKRQIRLRTMWGGRQSTFGKLGQDRGHWLKKKLWWGMPKTERERGMHFYLICLPSIWVAEGKGGRIESWSTGKNIYAACCKERSALGHLWGKNHLKQSCVKGRGQWPRHCQSETVKKKKTTWVQGNSETPPVKGEFQEKGCTNQAKAHTSGMVSQKGFSSTWGFMSSEPEKYRTSCLASALENMHLCRNLTKGSLMKLQATS